MISSGLLVAVAALLALGNAQSSCWPCSNRTNAATYIFPETGCCRICGLGSRCNGTTATLCTVPTEFQPSIGQPSCRATSACVNAYETAAPTTTTDRVCRALSRCVDGAEFERLPPTTTSDRTCTSLRACNATTEFEYAQPTATTDRLCRAVRTCNLITEQLVAAATATSDAQCSCRPDFVGSPCSKCENTIPGCDTCTHNGSVVCTRCLLGFQPVNRVDGLRCVRCNIFNCTECDDNDACIRCKEGTVLVSSRCEATTTTTTTTATTSQINATVAPAVVTSTDAPRRLLTVAIVVATVGVLATIGVIMVVVTTVRRRQRTQDKSCDEPVHLYEAPLAILPAQQPPGVIINSAYDTPDSQDPLYDNVFETDICQDNEGGDGYLTVMN